MKSFDEIVDIIAKIDFSYSSGIEYDYDRVESPDHDECCANDYCRCTTLEEFVLEKVNTKEFINTINDALEINSDLFDKDVAKICDELKTESFEFNVCGGYYGEELDSVLLEHFIIIKLANIYSIKAYRRAKLKKIVSNSENDVDYVLDEYVKNILTEEYGYILDSLEKSKFKIVDINTVDIIFPQNEYNEYIKFQNLSGYKNRKGVCGLVKLIDGKYHVIDGYHRINANIKKSTIKVILAYE